jgi:hypothetical protein
VLTYLFGPFLALLPRRWRNLLPMSSGVAWGRATVLSGFGEGAIALAALLFWYSYYMNFLVNHGLDSALAGKMGPGVTDKEIGFAALVIWAMHPLTWLLAYAGVEGAVRMVGAAFTENNLGILPLFIMDKIFLKLSGRSEQSTAKAAGYSQGNLSSYTGAIREKAMLKRLPLVPDELFFTGNGAEEILEIRACRRKPEWNPPRTVRYLDNYYRLEAAVDGTPPRPFRYTLRKLSAGVPGRTVLIYAPEEAPVLAKK